MSQYHCPMTLQTDAPITSGGFGSAQTISSGEQGTSKLNAATFEALSGGISDGESF